MGISEEKNHAETDLNNLFVKNKNIQKLNDADDFDDDADLIAWQNHKYLKRKSPKKKKTGEMNDSYSALTAASLFMPRYRVKEGMHGPANSAFHK
jgi:hypothetical protein